MYPVQDAVLVTVPFMPCPSSITSPDFVGGAGRGGYAFMTSSTGPSVLPPILPSPARETSKNFALLPTDDMCGCWWFAVDAFQTCKSARPHTRRDFHGSPSQKLHSFVAIFDSIL